MDRFTEWFWQRFRARFFLATGIFAIAVTSVAVAAPVIGLASLLGQSADHIPGEVAASISAMALIVTLGVACSPKERLPIQRWTRGDHSDPAGARDAALVVGERMTVRGVLLAAPFWLPAASLVFGRAIGVTGVGWAGVAIVCAYVFFVGTFIVGTGLRLLFRPLLTELDPELPADQAPSTRSWSLRQRVIVAFFTASLSTGIGAVGAAYFWGDTINSVVLAGYSGAFVMALYATTLVLVGVVQPTLRPLEEVIAATRRVREGDFGGSIALTSSDELGDLVLAFNEMTVGLRQREALQSAFGSYVDPALARRLLVQDSSIFDGEAVEASVFFADVRGFTNFAATVEPEEAVAELNRLFAILVPAIRDAGGHANRYTGDGVLAVFGTPEPLLDHADAAVTAALTIQAEVKRVFGEALRVGIGVNSGKVIAGSIGAAGKLDFTVIGDVVNVAARVEEHTKQTGDAILVTQATVDALTGASRAVDRGNVLLRGRDAAVRVYALDG